MEDDKLTPRHTGRGRELRRFLAQPPRWLLPLVLSPFVLLIVAYLGWFFLWSRYQPMVPAPSTRMAVPPSAQELQVRELDPNERSSWQEFDQRTVFFTSEHVETIMAFYRREMEKLGWFVGAEQITGQKRSIGFGWQYGCPFWSAGLNTAPADDGRTRVQLDIAMEPCR